ncbi:serine threonine- kinase NIM1 isoform X1, putative [Babesia ovata]|uniref:Serine threonine-kinase NIM1 isoform X1, putative n=1 Tax=Babesia ovata TaxID=189622 RepID=A0A2H6KIH5_9APIC|nr:serine threonine- kinase NIM1 isoform X1, putative [Babesia ovata]GBE62779.1 serine threonine- kinase NIM1 isoform X1, putative [Babesia ovata]
MIQVVMHIFRLLPGRLDGGVRSLSPPTRWDEGGFLGVTARRQTARETTNQRVGYIIGHVLGETFGYVLGQMLGYVLEEHDEDVERGDEPECCDGEEEGRPDVPEELITLVEEISEILRGEDLGELRGEAGA